MRFNPFEEKPMPLDQLFMDWDKLYPKPYHLGTVHPYTKVRIVLMNGTEFEAQWFGHQFSRHCQDNDLRRELAMIRRIEQMQQKRISCLKPKNETVLEHTITYEQLAVDLTAFLARRENDYSFGSMVVAGNSASSNLEGFVYTAMNALQPGSE